MSFDYDGDSKMSVICFYVNKIFFTGTRMVIWSAM